MTRLIEFLAGMKTYLVAFAILFSTITLIATHALTPESGMALLLIAASTFPATIRDAMQRHHQETVELLDESAQVLAALVGHNLNAARAAATQAAVTGYKLAQEVAQDQAPAAAQTPTPPSPAPTLTSSLSGDDAMKPAPGRFASIAEWDELRRVATGDKS